MDSAMVVERMYYIIDGKDLRNERKKIAKELECVQTITQCFDCEAMRDAYQYCEERIGEIQDVKALV